MKKFLIGFAFGVVVAVSIVGGALADRLVGFGFLNKLVPDSRRISNGAMEQKIVKEESVVIDVAEKVSPSVVTVSITKKRQTIEPFFLDPFGMFEFRRPGSSAGGERIKQDIGSGFIIGDGL